MQTCTVRCLRAHHNQQKATRQISNHHRQQLRSGSSICRDSWRTRYHSVPTLAYPPTSARTGHAQRTILHVYVPTTAQKALHWPNLPCFALGLTVQMQPKIRKSMRTGRATRSQMQSGLPTARSRSRPTFQHRPEQLLLGPHCLTLRLPNLRRTHQCLQWLPGRACRSLLRCRAPRLIHQQQQRELPRPRHLKIRHPSPLRKPLESR